MVYESTFNSTAVYANTLTCKLWVRSGLSISFRTTRVFLHTFHKHPNAMAEKENKSGVAEPSKSSTEQSAKTHLPLSQLNDASNKSGKYRIVCNVRLRNVGREVYRTMPRNLYHCKCRCGCEKKPGCRRVECHCCGHLVGLGCCLKQEEEAGITLCHLCFDANLDDRAKLLYEHWYFGKALVNYVFLIIAFAGQIPAPS